eukprot:gnl/TRDRNA2_/TRDRNA2_125937_c0_seq1.p1 gnl/TRDRNA2_/TRDRNA2_125937_c0~~gnl/TRDRNA2_/TRDRNA2_125937_c0_seq1.p1  ORF type:complete len:361 (+),score=44.50 gnl/TRDRNA2_/TRDRNA2_125937_c0_seq1:104-1186(+)
MFTARHHCMLADPALRQATSHTVCSMWKAIVLCSLLIGVSFVMLLPSVMITYVVQVASIAVSMKPASGWRSIRPAGFRSVMQQRRVPTAPLPGTAPRLGLPFVENSGLALSPVATRALDAEQGTVMEVHSEEVLDSILKESSELVLLYVSATWCGPCRAFEPKYRLMAEEYAKVRFLKLIGDENKSVSRTTKRLGVRSFPDFFIFRDGEIKARIIGIRLDELRSKLDENMVPEERPKAWDGEVDENAYYEDVDYDLPDWRDVRLAKARRARRARLAKARVGSADIASNNVAGAPTASPSAPRRMLAVQKGPEGWDGEVDENAHIVDDPDEDLADWRDVRRAKAMLKAMDSEKKGRELKKQ